MLFIVQSVILIVFLSLITLLTDVGISVAIRTARLHEIVLQLPIL